MSDVTFERAPGIRERVAANPLWYHTIELPGGVLTPGWFDLRPVVDLMPWPDVRGRRCLDVGTYDGFLAFELERRGASEVIATDISDHREWDFPAETRARGPAFLAEVAGPEKGLGFRIAREALGSAVDRQEINVYDLTPERVGTFDVVVCGSLMLHLRDPIRALEAIRSVCAGVFLSAEEVRVDLTWRHRRRPIADLMGEDAQWWVPNAAGHERMLHVAGFSVERSSRPYAIPLGPLHPGQARKGSLRRRLARRALRVGTGVPTHAVLARPRL